MLVIVGDSHAIALRNGLERLRASRGSALEERYGAIVAGQLDHGYKFLQRFYALDRDSLHFAESRPREIFGKLVGPSEPRITREDPRQFVFCLGFHPSGSMQPKHWTTHTCSTSAASTKHYVSTAALEALVRSYNAEILAFFGVLQRLNVRFSVASCNPLPREFLKHWRTESFSEEEILTYHNRFRDSFCKELDAMGVQYHLPPPTVYDENGLMWQAMANDTKEGDYHANSTYGALMVEHILAELFGPFDARP